MSNETRGSNQNWHKRIWGPLVKNYCAKTCCWNSQLVRDVGVLVAEGKLSHKAPTNFNLWTSLKGWTDTYVLRDRDIILKVFWYPACWHRGKPPIGGSAFVKSFPGSRTTIRSYGIHPLNGPRHVRRVRGYFTHRILSALRNNRFTLNWQGEVLAAQDKSHNKNELYILFE